MPGREWSSPSITNKLEEIEEEIKEIEKDEEEEKKAVVDEDVVSLLGKRTYKYDE